MDRLDPVSYFISILDDIDLGWRIRSLQMYEAISEPYEIVAEIVTDGFGADSETDLLLGRSIELTIQRGGLARPIYGVIHRVDDLGATEGLLYAVVHIVPAFALLEQRVDTRIFQGLTVPEIVKTVLDPALAEYERELDIETCLGGHYEPRDCCIQFRESDFDFCVRLLEEEGIAYVFEADEEAGREKLVLIDTNESYPSLALGLGDEVEIIVDRREQADRESLAGLELAQRELPTKVFTRAYNFKGVSVDEFPKGEADPRGRTRELYLHDDRRQIVDDPVNDPAAQEFTGEDIDQREPQAVHRLELERRDVKVLVGDSNLSGAHAGVRFVLGGHHRDDLGHTEYLITRVTHKGEADEVGRRNSASYSNTIECIPFVTPYRPSLHTPKPRIYGAQTATVMGPADDEKEDIHTDPHGRVKIRFHWDRLSPNDETASCWVRCAQMWAGAGWGTMFIPRVGMEVVVTFLDGNPDRPLIVGCVYNADRTPPYTLPDEKTKSTIRSDSSPGGGGFNELRFEDAVGNEEIFLHAQKDLNEVIENNMTTSVGHDQTLSVGNERTKTVTGNETIEVKKDRITTIHGTEHMHIMGSHNLTIDGKAAKDKGKDPGVLGSGVDVKGEYNIKASDKFTVTVGASQLIMDKTTITLQTSAQILIKAGDGTTITMVPAKIEGVSATVELKGGSGGASVLKLDGAADLKGGSQAKIHKNGAAHLTLTADAVLHGATTTCHGTGTAELKGDSSAKVTGGGVTVGGSPIDINTSGACNVTGSPINLNG